MPKLTPELLELLSKTAGEALIVLRMLLRSDDEKIRRDAARLLLIGFTTHFDGSSQSTSEEARQLAELLTQLDENQLDRWADETTPQCLGPADETNSPGPD